MHKTVIIKTSQTTFNLTKHNHGKCIRITWIRCPRVKFNEHQILPQQIANAILGAMVVLAAASTMALPTFSETSLANSASTVAATGAVSSVVPLLQHTETRDEFGQYALSYLTGDGIAVAEQAALKPTADGTDNVLVKQGSYAHVGDDGRTYTTHWVADELGFRAFGDHLPVAPQLPPVVQ